MSVRISITESMTVGRGCPLLLIAGPCQIENFEHCIKIADHLLSVCRPLGVNLVFKSSYDKANRTSLHSKRGPGIDEGLRILEKLRSELGIPVLTDVHSAAEAEIAGGVVDILQTPAFLCRQTDLLLAAGASGRVINVKKGQFVAPEDMRHTAEKIASTGNKKIMLCERGSCFGFRDLVVDMRGLTTMRGMGYPVIFDATHSVQSMGGADGASGGNSRFIAPLSRAAAAVGIDGLFLECHDNPASAPSDGLSMLELEDVKSVVTAVYTIHKLCSDSGF